MPAEIPIRSFFSFQARCLYRQAPRTVDGDLQDWADEYRLPDLSEVAAEAPFAEVYAAWNEDGLYLAVAAKAQAFIQQRGYVTPQDVKSIGADCLRHRVIISYEAEAEDKTSEDIIKEIFDNIEVP